MVIMRGQQEQLLDVAELDLVCESFTVKNDTLAAHVDLVATTRRLHEKVLERRDEVGRCFVLEAGLRCESAGELLRATLSARST